MSKYKRDRLLEMAGITHRSEFLLKEEEEEAADADTDIFKDDADADTDTDPKESDDIFADADADTDTKDEDEDKDKEDKEEEEEEEAVEAVSKDDIAEFGPGLLDQEVDAKIADIFTGAMKTAQVASTSSIGYPGSSAEEVYEESLKNYNLKYLLEAEENEVEHTEEFDLGYFASETARLIKNYDVLLDMEGMIFNKARQFIINKFDAELETDFVEMLATAHGIDLKDEYLDSDPAHNPTAVGASPAAAGV
jgi:hypothetical protein